MSEKMHSVREKSAEWYLGLRGWERVLVLAVCCGVVILLWGALLLWPLESDLRSREGQLAQAQQSLISMQAQQGMAPMELPGDSNKALLEEFERVLRQAEQAGDALLESTDAWVSPKHMVGVLRSMLERRGNVRLVSLSSIRPVALHQLEKDATPLPYEEHIYEHAVEVVLDSEYFALLAYLEELEKMQPQFIWDVLDYEVREYPHATVRLRLKTLSASSQWLEVGV